MFYLLSAQTNIYPTFPFFLVEDVVLKILKSTPDLFKSGKTQTAKKEKDINCLFQKDAKFVMGLLLYDVP